MMRGFPWIALIAASCSYDRTRPCATETDCARGEEPGVCLASPVSDTSWCAFLDESCGQGGVRWSDRAGDDLAGECHILTHGVAVTVSGQGSIASMPEGITCEPDCAQDFASGASVTLTATSAPGWSFTTWTGDAAGCADSPMCTLIVDRDVSVGATFVEGYELAVTLAGSGSGHVLGDPRAIDCPTMCSNVIPGNDSIELTAIPIAGSRFDGWGGDCNGTARCTVVMTEPHDVAATFTDIYDWSTIVGDIQDDRGTVIAFDSPDVIVAGTFTGTITLGTDTLVSDGSNPDIFVTKLTPLGVPQWSRRVGGPGVDEVNGMVVDASHAIWIAGTFEESIDFGTGPIMSAGGTDAFVAQLSGQVGAFYATRFGGSDDDGAYAIVLDGPEPIVCGYFRGAVDFGPFAGTITAVGSPDAFIHKDLTWAVTSASPSTASAHCRSVATDGARITATGDFTSTANFGDGMISSTGSSDIFVVQIDRVMGVTQRSRSFGGIGYDVAHGVAVDPSDNIYVAGEFGGLLDFGGGPMMPDLMDGFVLRLSPADLSHAWSVQVGGAGTDGIRAIAATASSICVAGDFQSRLDFGDGTAISLGESDAFALQLSAADGSYTWINGLGGGLSDGALGVAADLGGSVAVTGYVQGDVDLGGGMTSATGADDIFFAKYAP